MTPGHPARDERRRRRTALIVFSAVQAFAAAFILFDAIADIIEQTVTPSTALEALIALGLTFGAGFGVWEIRRIHALLTNQERALSAAAGALAEIIEAQFDEWDLTPAERDVAMMALKGLDNREIAEIRQAATGTVRAQISSIYGKANVSSRAQLAAFFVEDLMTGGIAGASPQA